MGLFNLCPDDIFSLFVGICQPAKQPVIERFIDI